MSDTVAHLIRQAAKQLGLRGIETAALDARLLLQFATDMRREEIVAEPDLILTPDLAACFWSFVERRCALEPVSRILGSREFYGREFQVTPAVLDPRADTETLIAAALPLARGKCRILDLGTGSGAIIATLLAERPEALGVASDVSEAALGVARVNAEAQGVSGRLTLLRADWFDGIEGQFDLIVSNPPYIASAEIAGLAVDVRDFDPLGALDGGADGLAAYRRIAAGASGHLVPKGQVLVELGAGQEADVRQLFEAAGFGFKGQAFDLGGHVRCLTFGLP
jgi:release factor glutamine methyltransferase